MVALKHKKNHKQSCETCTEKAFMIWSHSNTRRFTKGALKHAEKISCKLSMV